MKNVIAFEGICLLKNIVTTIRSRRETVIRKKTSERKSKACRNDEYYYIQLNIRRDNLAISSGCPQLINASYQNREQNLSLLDKYVPRIYSKDLSHGRCHKAFKKGWIEMLHSHGHDQPWVKSLGIHQDQNWAGHDCSILACCRHTTFTAHEQAASQHLQAPARTKR